jgi:hypothetical protein
MCHYGHLLEFLVALFCYLWLWPQTFPHASTLSLQWIWKVVAFNLACEALFFGGWHWMMYSGAHVSKNLKAHKYNPKEQYADAGDGHLAREIFFTTLGWLQSSAFMITMMHLWASGRVPYLANFWVHPAWNVGSVLFVTCKFAARTTAAPASKPLALTQILRKTLNPNRADWREIHFYWCHRAMHPWFPLPSGGGDKSTTFFDPGRFIYKWVHALHHKSVNPGPFSGLSMTPFEHFFYYTCTLLPLLTPLHPMHFLYAKFHADIAPVGGHDGYAFPGGGGDFHWLHHDKFDCNYGVPLFDFDWLFGSWVDYKCYRDAGSDLAKGRALTYKRFGWLGLREKAA